MLKKSTTSYNKHNMKTLDAKALKTKKENLHAQFEIAKKNALAYENAIAKANEKRGEWLEKMAQLQGAYQAVTDLEKQIGVTPEKETLQDNKGKEVPTKK